MEKVRIELDFEEFISVLFMSRKAAHYTRYFDPSFFQAFTFPDIQKYLDSYDRFAFKIRSILIKWNHRGAPEVGPEVTLNTWNATFVEVDDDSASENDGKGTQ